MDFQFVDEGVVVDGVVDVGRALVVLENVVVDEVVDVVDEVVDVDILMVIFDTITINFLDTIFIN